MRFKNTLAAVLVAAAIIPAGAASAQDTRQLATSYSLSAVNEGRDVVVSLEDGFSFDTIDGQTVVRDPQGVVSEAMPTGATDSDGEEIGFFYEKISDSELLVVKTGPNGTVAYGWWSDWGKCVAGTAGSAIGGGAAGGPWGAVGGGLVGAATFC
ncbi:hypothetical protein SAMN04488539_1696 [Corynebacterium timonense]|uniref:Uncharacterized protein n=1 Tax=Corynebacterium timonense TaxID=441500 RepID=A0A1H1SAA3_9CORY|nr:hypothetical protein SAMN04488539_1696 [Corynebacterium timonense]